MEKMLTIFTPTYNRGYILDKLYNSLLNQRNKDFKWLIVDDGSTDNTKKLVKSWIDENKIEIKYIYQENQGKHIAHNVGVDNCDTELFFCVDSDDYLLDNAVNDIVNEYNKISSDRICGIMSIKLTNDMVPIGTDIPYSVIYSNLSDLYEKYKFKGDTSLVFKTDVLRKYKFPKIDDEKFIGEEYIYCQIDKNYKLYISQNRYYVCDYLDDGYTKNMFKLIANNPKGYMLLKKIKIKHSRSFSVKYKSASLYIVGCWLSRSKGIIKNSPNKSITILAYPLAFVVYYLRFKKIIRIEN